VTTAVASSVLQDFGLITESDTSLIIDKSKIRRENQQTRTELHNRFEMSPKLYTLMVGKVKLWYKIRYAIKRTVE
jgi:hypothetical protein